ncbi:MAG: hypothetical protein JWR61_2240 [Ferruginibacter sp.]|nr:hypothetical protein [Ferruginibacter sp.]
MILYQMKITVTVNGAVIFLYNYFRRVQMLLVGKPSIHSGSVRG